MPARETFAVAGCPAFVLRPTGMETGGLRPWVWYAPTIGAYPNSALDWYFDRLRQRGLWIAGLDVGEQYASRWARSKFDAFYRHVRDRFALAPRARFIAQSRGALDVYAFAARHPERVDRIAGIYSVMDYRSYPGIKAAAAAHGQSEADFLAIVETLNPIDNLGPLARARIPLFHLHGDRDQLVPLSANAQPAKERYLALEGAMQLGIVAGLGHIEAPEFFQSPALLNFLAPA